MRINGQIYLIKLKIKLNKLPEYASRDDVRRRITKQNKSNLIIFVRSLCGYLEFRIIVCTYYYNDDDNYNYYYVVMIMRLCYTIVMQISNDWLLVELVLVLSIN